MVGISPKCTGIMKTLGGDQSLSHSLDSCPYPEILTSRHSRQILPLGTCMDILAEPIVSTLLILIGRFTHYGGCVLGLPGPAGYQATLGNSWRFGGRDWRYRHFSGV